MTGLLLFIKLIYSFFLRINHERYHTNTTKNIWMYDFVTHYKQVGGNFIKT
jgi:hypothetical protein